MFLPFAGNRTPPLTRLCSPMYALLTLNAFNPTILQGLPLYIYVCITPAKCPELPRQPLLPTHAPIFSHHLPLIQT